MLIKSWEEFIKLLEDNQNLFKYTIKKFWLDKEKGFYEDYIEIFYNGVTLLINDEFKEVSVVEKNGYQVINEMIIATKCTYDRYMQIIEAIFDINVEI